MDKNINFPHLGIYLENVGKSIDIGGFAIAYYGIIISCAMLIGLLIMTRRAKELGENTERYVDLFIYVILFGVLGARIYYVIFSWDSYRGRLMDIFNLRQGGLAIYGGILAGTLTCFVFSRIRRMSFGTIMDTIAMAVVNGQMLGRWGNFFNREAFGEYTDSLFAMQLPVSAVRAGEITPLMKSCEVVVEGIRYVQVHPTFLYESAWNAVVLVILFVTRNRTAFRGELFFRYLIGYGIGRFFIESLRTDQLLIPGSSIPVSQGLSAVLVIGSLAATFLIRVRMRKQHTD